MSENKEKYVKDTLTPILERMVAHLMVKKPEEPIQYMIHYLEKKKGIATKALTPEERAQLSKLERQAQELKTDIQDLEAQKAA